MSEQQLDFMYNGEPVKTPEQEALKRELQRLRRAQLPKFELGEDEEFYLSREEVQTINNTYFTMLDEYKSSLLIMPEEMRSYVESVIFASYKSDIKNKQRDKSIAGERKIKVYELKRELMTPAHYKKHRFSRKLIPNYPMR
ncbi:MAG: hypothetical protein HDQ88_10580, partial [Clostridia bacterium]|nr:hypothetical protein [Clostridia bacterium]